VRILVAALAFALVCGVVGSNVAQATHPVTEKPKLALSISANPTTVKSGSKITIQIETTNTSGQSIVFRSEPMEYRYEAVVRDAQGNLVADTEHGREARRPPEQYSGGGFPLEPGKTTKDELVISDLYDLSRPGKYSVQVRCRGAKSNTITVTVVP